MKTTLFLLFIVSVLWLPNSFAQYQDHTQKDLPVGAKARLSTDYTEQVSSIAFSPDGLMLASSSTHIIKGAKIHLWDPRTGELRHLLAWDELGNGWELMQVGVWGVAFTPESRTVAASTSTEITLWDTATGVIERSIYTGHKGYKYIDGSSKIVFNPWDGGKLVFGGSKGKVHLWNLQASTQPVDVPPDHPKAHPKVTLGVREHGLPGHTDIVTGVAVSPNGMRIASGSFDHTVRLWNWNAKWGSLLDDVHYTLKGHTDVVFSVAFSPDGYTLASASADNTIRLWDVRTRELLDIIEADDMGWVFSVAFSPDGQMLASGGDWDDLRLWDVRIRPSGLIRTLKGHTDRVLDVAFSPDGQTLASGSADGTVLLWEVPFAPPLRFLKLAEDVNADDIVNIQDLVLVAANLGKTGEHPADVNGDNVVNILDLTLVAKAMGWATPQAHHK